MSTSTGTAPASMIAPMVGMAVNGVVMTSAPGLHAENAQRQDDGPRTVSHADHFRRVQIARELALEMLDLRAERVTSAGEHTRHGCIDLGTVGKILRLKVNAKNHRLLRCLI